MDESIRALSWQEKAQACSDRIEKEGYYLDLWEKIRPATPFTALTKEKALAPFRDLWEALPDYSGVRHGPFTDICELAEEYCYGEDGDSDPERVAAAATAKYEPVPGQSIDNVISFVKKQGRAE